MPAGTWGVLAVRHRPVLLGQGFNMDARQRAFSSFHS
jgi:hypothetical protein